MRRVVALLALLLPLAASAAAEAHVTKPGYSEVRQHGTKVNYVLGGAEGTFLFDPDHTVMTADSPHFTRFVEQGVEHIVLGWDHVVFLIILLLGARKLRDVIELATAFTAAHSVTLALAILVVVNI